jgi:two-component system, OmpR family, phosphate regulon sensor histidine kinase PhoR
MRDFVVHYVLQPNGYQTLTAEDGAAGLGLARLVRPDVIVADMKMPGISGLEIAQTLQREGLNIPVILISAEGPEEVARQALRAGVADYLTKPFAADNLIEAIRRVLELAQARREPARTQSELTVVNAALLQRLKELETLVTVGRNVTSVLDLDQVLSNVVESAVSLTGADEGSILLLDERTQELTMRAAKNFDDNFVRTFRLPTENSLAGQVIRTGQPVLLDDDTPQKIKTSYLVRSLIYVPLNVHGRTIGVLGVDNRQAGREFTGHDQQVLQVLGDYAAVAIDNARLYSRTETERTKLETILEKTEDGVMVVDPENYVVLMNPTACSAFGVNGTEVAGRRLDEIIQHTEVRDLFTSERNRGEIVLEDGRVFNAHLTPIAGVGRAMVMQDITHLKEIDRIKSEFVTTVSHDLRSPLTAILGYVELISRVGPVSEQQAEFIRRIQFSVQSITTLITELLDLGRIEAGFDAQKESTHLSLVLHYAAEGLRQRAEEKHLNLTVTVPNTLPQVLANPPRLRQMAANLIDNAIKYTPDGGAVTVEAQPDGDLIVITVSDTGIGIPIADQAYIFNKFYRASNVRQEYLGTGLGLAIVKSIVEDHGGRIWLESKPNAGATFTVVLPQYKETGKQGDR